VDEEIGAARQLDAVVAGAGVAAQRQHPAGHRGPGELPAVDHAAGGVGDAAAGLERPVGGSLGHSQPRRQRDVEPAGAVAFLDAKAKAGDAVFEGEPADGEVAVFEGATRLQLVDEQREGAPRLRHAQRTALEKTNLNLERVSVLSAAVACRPCYLRDCPIDHRCMTRIPPEVVVDECERALAPGFAGAQRVVGGLAA
jgi:hypothetical protein